jgi:hypothetical protein
MRLDGVQLFELGPMRITHRFEPSTLAWPTIALELGGATGTSVANGTIAIQHRLATTITNATFEKLGVLSTFSNARRVNNLSVEHRIAGKIYPPL